MSGAGDADALLAQIAQDLAREAGPVDILLTPEQRLPEEAEPEKGSERESAVKELLGLLDDPRIQARLRDILCD